MGIWKLKKKVLNEYKVGDSHKYTIEGMRIWFCGKERIMGSWHGKHQCM
jgi:hypothetical protein